MEGVGLAQVSVPDSLQLTLSEGPWTPPAGTGGWGAHGPIGSFLASGANVPSHWALRPREGKGHSLSMSRARSYMWGLGEAGFPCSGTEGLCPNRS